MGTDLHVVSMPIAGEMGSLHGRVVKGHGAGDAGEHVRVGHVEGGPVCSGSM